jgi:hypothetical protein
LWAEALLSLKEPVKPAPAIPGKLQEKFFLMATMGDVPHLSGNVMPIRSRHS